MGHFAFAQLILLVAAIGCTVLCAGDGEPVSSVRLVRATSDSPFVAFSLEGTSLVARVSEGHALGTRLRSAAPQVLVSESGGPLGQGAVHGYAATAGEGRVMLFWGAGPVTQAVQLQIENGRLVADSPCQSVGAGVPCAALTDHAGQPCVAGLRRDAGQTAVWFVREANGRWQPAIVASGDAYEPPALAVSDGGTFRIVWRDAAGRVWHSESRDGLLWLRSGGTSRLPECIGQAIGAPTLACSRAQAVVAYANDKGQIEYSHFTGQHWDVSLPLTAGDPRFANDKCTPPTFAIAGDGVPWLFFINETRRFVYFTRWLGFGFSPITVARSLFSKSPDFSTYLLPIEAIGVEARAWPGSEDLGLTLASNELAEGFRAETIATPVLVAHPGENHLFVDTRELSRSLFVEQHVPGPTKHEGNPVLTHGPEGGFDSYRVFNGGSVIRDADRFRMWYGALNPAGDWQHWTRLPRTGYAESDDGLDWRKPKVGLAEWKGSKDNNMVPPFGIVPFVMRNPDERDPERRFLAYFTGSRFWSTDGLHWTKDKGFGLSWSGCKPQWFKVDSLIYAPDEPDPRLRWKAYGCFAPKDPQRAIGLMFSPDGLQWTAHPENPIMSPLCGTDKMLHDVSVFRCGKYYLGIAQKGHGYSIGLALIASRDGLNWWPVCEGTPFIPQGKGDAWDRGLLLPSQPVTVGDEAFIYYGGANYQAPTDQPFDYERWKQCNIGCGLARMQKNRWVGLRTMGSVRHIGYVTTAPIRVTDLDGCVLTVNVDGCDDRHYLLAEILDGDSDDHVPGYEHEHCDEVHTNGLRQALSWKGCAGLGRLPRDSHVRLRFIFRGDRGRPLLYSWAFAKDPAAKPPTKATRRSDLVETSLVHQSSVGDIHPLKSWIGFKADGKPKPLVVLMHGYGDPVLRHGGQRMVGAVRSYAQRGLFAIAPDLRGREESAGLRDDGGLEILDIYDAVQAALEQYPRDTDPRNINIIGWSGGGGNTFSAVVRFPDLFSNAAAFYGIPDYACFADAPHWRGICSPNVGGTPAQVPDRYLARNSTLAAVNVRYTNFHFYWDEEETICPAQMNDAFAVQAKQLGYPNIHPHRSKATDAGRWLHTGITRPAGLEFDRTFLKAILDRNNPDPQLAPEGDLIVPGFLMTKRFQILFGHGNDAVVKVRYVLDSKEYRFDFRLLTSDPSVRGWLRVTDRRPEEVESVRADGQKRTIERDCIVRELSPNSDCVIQLR